MIDNKGNKFDLKYNKSPSKEFPLEDVPYEGLPEDKK